MQRDWGLEFSATWSHVIWSAIPNISVECSSVIFKFLRSTSSWILKPRSLTLWRRNFLFNVSTPCI
jgi:hypothetical protein